MLYNIPVDIKGTGHLTVESSTLKEAIERAKQQVDDPEFNLNMLEQRYGTLITFQIIKI